MAWQPPSWNQLTPEQQKKFPEGEQQYKQITINSQGNQGPLIDMLGAGGPGGAYKTDIKNPFIDAKTGQATSENKGLAQQFQDSYNESQMDKAKMAGAPEMPTWTSQLGDNGLLRQPGLNTAPGQSSYNDITKQIAGQFGAGTNVNQQPLRALENYAQSTSPSPWLQQALKNNQDLTTTGVNNAASQSAANTAGAESNLAMRGGLSSGARERLQKAGGSSGLAAAQDVRNAGNTNANNLALQEEGSKISTLQGLPSAEIAAIQPEVAKQEYLGNVAQAQNTANTANQQFNIGQGAQSQQFNIQNALNELMQGRGFDANNYNQQMKAWAAGKSADAQAGAGGGGCFITTAVCEYLGLPDDNEILNTFREFRDQHLGGKSSELLKHYYEIAPILVSKIKDDNEELNRLLCTYLMPSFMRIKNGEFVIARKIYEKMVRDLEYRYLNHKKAIGA